MVLSRMKLILCFYKVNWGGPRSHWLQLSSIRNFQSFTPKGSDRPNDDETIILESVYNSYSNGSPWVHPSLVITMCKVKAPQILVLSPLSLAPSARTHQAQAPARPLSLSTETFS